MHLKGWAENFSKTPNRAIFASICDIRVIWLVPTYALQTECICIFLLLQHKGGFGCRKYGDCTKWRKKCAMEETMCNFLCVSRTLYFPFRCEAISFVTFSRPFFVGYVRFPPSKFYYMREQNCFWLNCVAHFAERELHRIAFMYDSSPILLTFPLISESDSIFYRKRCSWLFSQVEYRNSILVGMISRRFTHLGNMIFSCYAYSYNTILYTLIRRSHGDNRLTSTLWNFFCKKLFSCPFL